MKDWATQHIFSWIIVLDESYRFFLVTEEQELIITSGTSNTLGAIASTSEGLAAIKDLENSCHAANLIFQCLRIVSQHFEEVWWGWHGGVLLLLPVHNSCELSTTAGRSSSTTVSPLHNKDINEHQQTPPAMAFIAQHTSLLLLQHKSNQITGSLRQQFQQESHTRP